jgi:nucleoside-diphosphate kinase
LSDVFLKRLCPKKYLVSRIEHTEDRYFEFIRENTMAVEKTFVMLKPDCVKRGLMGEVITRIERKGYRITLAKMMMLDEEILAEHYPHKKNEPYFPEIVSYMTSGPVLSMIVEGENAVHGIRILMGATDPDEAAAGTIRGDFANIIRNNIIHGSDSAKSAAIEIGRFFR